MARVAPGAVAPVVGALASASAADLWRFLIAQRWFAAKAAFSSDDTPAIRVTNPVVMPWGDGRYGIVHVDVDVGRTTQTYQLPLAVGDALPDEAPPAARIATLPSDDVLFDAVYDPEFRAGLAAELGRGASSASPEGSTWAIQPVQPRIVAPPASTRLGSAEQSNTSIVVDYASVIKLFRLLSSGRHPDAEMSEFLTTRTDFANTPMLLATMRMESAGSTTTTGIAHVYMPQSTDAWTYTLEKCAAFFAAHRERELANPFVVDANQLGVVTRRMHEALASRADDPAFAPQPATDEDLEQWADRARDAVHHAMALLEEQLASSRIPRNRLGEATALAKRRDHYLAWIDEIVDGLDDDLGLRIRIHGDFHLGQVLRTADADFMIIDFEGEPSKPLEERRDKTSPLRDVAGMLRSIGYAAATLAASVEKTVDAATRELRAGRWERDVRAAYLAGYLDDAPADSHLLPDDPANVDALLSLFEAEKAFYELSYELNNRPEWVWIPMRGVSKLLTRGAKPA